jgi:hypothetical protein
MTADGATSPDADEAASNVVRFLHPYDGDFVRRAHEALVIALLYWEPERWARPSIAAAFAMAPELGRVPTPQQWTEIVDEIDDALAPILRDLGVAQLGGPRPAP